MHAYNYDVRFGDVSLGGLVHHTSLFDLLNHGIEELSKSMGYELREIVAEEGVPYAPVDFRVYFERYPPYSDTRVIKIHARPISIKERSFEVEYEFVRERDGITLSRIRQVHVTISADGKAAQLPERVRAVLEELLEASSPFRAEAVPHVSQPPLGEQNAFLDEVTFYSPSIEASQLGYFGDYFRFISNTLEKHLMDHGTSLGELAEAESIPFLPAASTFQFRRPIHFEEVIEVLGEVVEVNEQEIVVDYELRGKTKKDTRIYGAHSYGCYDTRGHRRPFAPAVLETVEDRLIGQ